eukprot:TRINITY_DN76354_c0_g1_i1.p1 TRINITY_DN76354_c0_g1~~TRINITY_DN76354_c0_g1_i1.p1  ORF type:complete len:639 (+),score=136.65 TRINITY_DN76354_c0_g1_i1:87-2003(+)
MPGTRDASVSLSWFEDYFGFEEDTRREFGFGATKKHFSFFRGLLTCQPGNGGRERTFQVGSFDILTLKKLREMHADEKIEAVSYYKKLGKLSFQNIVGDTAALHQDPANAGAVFQVCSLYNCLESVPPGTGPESGISMYAGVPVQGSAAAVACPAATVWRNYFANDSPKSLNCLAELEKFVKNDEEGYWTVRNGYCLPVHAGSIAEISQSVANDPGLADEVRAHVGVGIHWETEPSAGSGEIVRQPLHCVCQIFCSAPPLGFCKRLARASDWQGLAHALLDGVYDATLTAAAYLAATRKERVQVYLTLVGGGALGCRHDWIMDAIERALVAHGNDPLDVHLVHFAEIPRGLRERLRELELGREPRGEKSQGMASTLVRNAAKEKREAEQPALAAKSSSTFSVKEVAPADGKQVVVNISLGNVNFSQLVPVSTTSRSKKEKLFETFKQTIKKALLKQLPASVKMNDILLAVQTKPPVVQAFVRPPIQAQADRLGLQMRACSDTLVEFLAKELAAVDGISEVCTREGPPEVDSVIVGTTKTAGTEICQDHLEAGMATQSQVDGLTRAFEQFDANGDGIISRSEFIQALQAVDKNFFTVRVVDILLQEADQDGDGNVQYMEFFQWLTGEDEMVMEKVILSR